MYTIYRNIEGGGVEAHLNFPRPHLLFLERATNHNLVNFRVYLLPFADLTWLLGYVAALTCWLDLLDG